MVNWKGGRSANFSVVVFKGSMLNWGVDLPLLVSWCSRDLCLIGGVDLPLDLPI